MTKILLACGVVAILSVAATPAGEAGKPVAVCLVSGSVEYDSDKGLAKLQEVLEKKHGMKCLRTFRKTDTDLPGLENLERCDVAVFYTRRLQIDGPQLEMVKKYVTSGKPIIGIRTASHGFQKWLAMDADIFGGNYKNHYPAGPLCDVKIEPKAKDHPILKGVKEYQSTASLYKNTGLNPDVNILLTGTIPNHTEPLAWTRQVKGARVFYTSLGHQKDFDDENFLRLMVNAIQWTTGK